MPIHPDWQPIYQSFQDEYCDGSSEDTSPKGGPCPKSEQVFYAYCEKNDINYEEPRPKGEEAFRWVGDIIPEEREGQYFIRGSAIHPCKTYHPNQWPEIRVYLEEELEAAAKTLKGKLLELDHCIDLDPPNKVLESHWEDGAVEYVAEVSQDYYDLVKAGEIKHVSVRYDWRILEKMDGVAPRGLTFMKLSLLRRLHPGDPEASAEVWEGVVNKLKEIKMGEEGAQQEPSSEEGTEESIKWEPKTIDEFIDSELLKNRTIVFHGEVSERACKEASKRLEYLGMMSSDPIKVILNSVGGYVYDGLLVFDTIKKLVEGGVDVTCEARGLAASMGSIILQAGNRRIATPHTRFLIHEVSSWTWGKTSDVEEQTEELRKVNDMLKAIIAERSGKTPEEIEKIWHKKDVWMSAEEARDFGLIDNIVDKTFFESILKEQDDEREHLRREQRDRAEKYGIEPNPSGNLTKPQEYEHIPEDQFADPVNWKYPVDSEHARPALNYFNQPDNREEYSHAEQIKIMTKIIKACIANDIEVTYQADDPVYRDLPEDLKEKLAGYGEEGGEPGEGDGDSGLGQGGEPRRGEPKTDMERLLSHYGEETAQALFELIGEDAFKLLPDRGTGLEGVEVDGDDEGDGEGDEGDGEGDDDEGDGDVDVEALRAELVDASGRLDEALSRVKVLEDENADLKAKLNLGEGVVEPGVVSTEPKIPPGLVQSDRILAVIPRKMPLRWPAEIRGLLRKLRKLCVESQST